MNFDTKAIHTGRFKQDPKSAVSPPIYQTATYGWESLQEEPVPMYTRYGNPTRDLLEKTLADLERGSDCLCLSSGMAAVASVCSLLKAGDHVIAPMDAYGGTFAYLTRELEQFGVEATFLDHSDVESYRAAFRPNTRLVWLESPSNPTLKIIDLAACAEIAHRAGAYVGVDNTFASPYFQNPLDLGVDIVMHSATKYINGHSDVVMGALIWRNAEIGGRLRAYSKRAGNIPSPFDCWLVLRGLKTLGVRMRQHEKSAMRIAEFLASHSRVAAVHYPGLPTHPGHELAKRQMRGFSGMVAFEVEGGRAEAESFTTKTRLFRIAASLGGVESLIGYPPVMSHAMLGEEERLARGVTPGLLRLSVGLEDTDDLIEDLNQALG